MAILRELLESVRSGERAFRPASPSPEDMEAFQPIAKAFAFAKQEGYLDECVIHRESRSANSWYDLVVVPNGLSHKGESFLLQPSAGPEQRLEEVIEIRPNIAGVGINLRALWRRWRGK